MGWFKRMSKHGCRRLLLVSSILLLTATIGACGRSERVAVPLNEDLSRVGAQAQQPPALRKSLSEDEAMSQLFEVVQGAEGIRYIWKNFEAAPDAQKNRSLPLGSRENGEAWAFGIKELSPNRAVLVIGSTALDEEGERDECHACEGRASVFFFERKADGEWALAGSALHVDGFGSHGGSGKFDFVQLSPDRHGFVIESGGTFQGYTMSSASIFELVTDNRVEPRTEEFIRIMADYECDDEITADCYSVEGKWQFIPGSNPAAFDLCIDFEGYIADAQGQRENIHERALYSLGEKVFQLVEGRNPVPAP